MNLVWQLDCSCTSISTTSKGFSVSHVCVVVLLTSEERPRLFSIMTRENRRRKTKLRCLCFTANTLWKDLNQTRVASRLLGLMW